MLLPPFLCDVGFLFSSKNKEETESNQPKYQKGAGMTAHHHVYPAKVKVRCHLPWGYESSASLQESNFAVNIGSVPNANTFMPNNPYTEICPT